MEHWNAQPPHDQSVGGPHVWEDQEQPSSQQRTVAAGRRGLLDRWHRLTTPALPDSRASLASRELARRARLASTLLLIALIVWLVSGVAQLAFNSAMAGLVLVFLIGLGFLGLLLFLNRHGLVSVVGGILIALIYLSFVLILRTVPHLDPSEVAIFDILIYAALIAVSLLPSFSIVPVAVCNCGLILLGVFGLQGAAPLALSQTRALDTFIVQPLTLQIIVAVVTYLWVRSTEQAIVRADQAQLLAALQQREAERKRELEEGLQELLQTFTLAANGNLTARAALSQEHVLWQVGAMLNSLLGRLQRAEQLENMVQRTSVEVGRLVEAIQAAKAGRPPLWPRPSGTLVDPVIQAVTDRRLNRS